MSYDHTSFNFHLPFLKRKVMVNPAGIEYTYIQIGYNVYDVKPTGKTILLSEVK